MISRRGGYIYSSAKFKHENTWYVLEVLTKSSRHPPQGGCCVCICIFFRGPETVNRKSGIISQGQFCLLWWRNTCKWPKRSTILMSPLPLVLDERTHVRLNSPLTSHRESSWEEGGRWCGSPRQWACGGVCIKPWRTPGIPIFAFTAGMWAH